MKRWLIVIGIGVLGLAWAAQSVHQAYRCRNMNFALTEVVRNGTRLMDREAFDGAAQIPVTAVEKGKIDFQNDVVYLECLDQVQDARRLRLVEFQIRLNDGRKDDLKQSAFEADSVVQGGLRDATLQTEMGDHPQWRNFAWSNSPYGDGLEDFIKGFKPEWLPLAALNSNSFMGFWGNGWLFKGGRPNQYFWIG